VICAKGNFTHGQVRDKSDIEAWEVSHGIQDSLGVSPYASSSGAIYARRTATLPDYPECRGLTSRLQCPDLSRTCPCVKLPLAQITRSSPHFEDLKRELGMAIQVPVSEHVRPFSQLLSQANKGRTSSSRRRSEFPWDR